jgi:hypothetical protein
MIGYPDKDIAGPFMERKSYAKILCQLQSFCKIGQINDGQINRRVG